MTPNSRQKLLNALIIPVIISLINNTHAYPQTETEPISKDQKKDDDLETSASGHYHETRPFLRPLNFGAALEAEMERQKILQDIFPPPNISYYKPYAERTVALLKFPVISPNAFIFKSGDSNSNNCTFTFQGAKSVVENPEIPVEGEYGPPPLLKPLQYSRVRNPGFEDHEIPSPPDVGVVVSQSYILRENVRDYLNITGSFVNGKPQRDLLKEMAKALGKKNFEEAKRKRFSPPLNPYYRIYNPYEGLEEPEQGPRFVLLHLESYLKTTRESRRFGFVEGQKYSNGTIYFPRKQTGMTQIPFVLRTNGEIDYIFESEGNYGGNDFGALLKAKAEIRSFVRLVHSIHEEVDLDGKVAVERALRASEKLDKPRFINTTDDEPRMAAREAEARLNSWLYTSSIGIRSITYPKLIVPREHLFVDPLVPLVEPHHVHLIPEDGNILVPPHVKILSSVPLDKKII